MIRKLHISKAVFKKEREREIKQVQVSNAQEQARSLNVPNKLHGKNSLFI